MNKCPNCSQTFTDDNIFCPNDGTTLITADEFDEQPVSHSMPTVAVPKFTPTPTSVLPPKRTPPILYGALGGMAVLILVLAGFLFFSGNSSESEKNKTNSANKSEVTSSKKTDDTNNTTSDTQQTYPAANSQNFEESNAGPNLQPPKPYISPAGNWQGQWTNGKGSAYRQQFMLKDDGNGRINGQITHTLQSTINPEKEGKIGLTAVEYVQGIYDPNTRIINLSGVRKDDPNDLIILDKYRLSLSSDNLTIAGETVGGKTRGRVTLRR